MVWVALRNRPSWREVLASVAVVDLLVRSGLAAELLAPVASLVAGTVAAGTMLAEVTTWAVFGVGFYLVAPVVYPAETGFPRERQGFRLLFAATALTLGVAVSAVSSPTAGLVAIAVSLGTGYAGFLAYLRRFRGWRITHPKYPPVRPVEQFTPFESIREEIKRDLQREGALGAIGRGLWIAAFGIVLLFPCLLAGVLAVALGNAFPLYDLLVLGWVLSNRLGWTPGGPDPETRLFEQLARSGRNLKGLMLVLFATVGLVVSGMTVYAGFSFAAAAIPPGPSSVAWTLFGIVAWLIASGAYGFAVWYAELRRVPAFLDEWTGRPEPTVDPPRTPPGHVLPATLLGIGAVVVTAAMDRADVRTAFGVAWPLGVLAAGWGLHRWRGRGTAGVWAEDRTILWGLLAHGLLVVVAGNVDAVEAALSGEVPAVDVLDSLILVGLALLAVVGWLPDIERLDDPDHPLRRFLLPGYGILVAAVAASASVLAPGSIGTAFGAVAAVCLAGSLGLLVVRRYGL